MISNDAKLQINIEDHIGLVHLCCQRFKQRGAEYEDIFQSGCLGLAKAVKNFDFERGVKFSTYAIPVILGEIKLFFRNNSSLKVSRSLKDLSIKIRVMQEKFLKTHFKEPTLSELSEMLNISKEQILEALDINKPFVSLDDSEKKEFPVFFEDEKISFRVSLTKALNDFNSTDRNLIYLRFFKCITQSKVAEKLGMTQVQVSRREKVLLKMLRERLC